MLADRLSKAWDARRGSTAIDPVMRFSDKGLVLGAGTVLAKSDGSGRNLSVDPSEPRLRALLAAAHGRRPTVGALAHLRKAAELWSNGQDALSAMHLVLSQVDRLEQPKADAHRLFLADGLLNAGFEANAIIDAVEAGGAALERLQKYDPDQPRVPAGSGRTSGEWTSTDGGSSFGAPSAEGLAESPQPEVNPNTITQVQNTNGSYQGPDACYRARQDCRFNVVSDSMRHDQANDNLKETYYFQCYEAEGFCNVIDFAVERTPFFKRGGVLYPDGGVVIANKGEEAIYYPRGIASLKWPYRSWPSQK